ncbi:hypothetical protein [Streptomyces sodiiphilus]|uniref:hypothetical protein n=1 Tax=Streptomyces sodiiphilus TaxID=226217 RepID=UPI0031DA101D
MLIVFGGLLWVGFSGWFIDDIDRPGGHVPIPALAAFALVGTALAGARPVGR